MLDKYRGMSEQEKWVEYARLKDEFASRIPAPTEQEYDEFIARIVENLGI